MPARKQRKQRGGDKGMLERMAERKKDPPTSLPADYVPKLRNAGKPGFDSKGYPLGVPIEGKKESPEKKQSILDAAKSHAKSNRYLSRGLNWLASKFNPQGTMAKLTKGAANLAFQAGYGAKKRKKQIGGRKHPGLVF